MTNKLKGICKNIDGCDKAERGEVQEIERSAKFECEECHKPLQEVKDKSRKKKGLPTLVVLIIGVLLLGGIGIGAYFIFSGNSADAVTSDTTGQVGETDHIPVTSVSLDMNSLQMKNVKTVALIASVLPEDATNKDLIWSSSDENIIKVDNNGTITTVNPGIAVIKVMSAENNSIYDECTITVEKDEPEPVPVSGKEPVFGAKTYSFGKYEGYLLNGRPEGQGTMSYTCRVQIARHGNNTYYAESGDVFVGLWGNGDIVNGKLNDRNNNQKAAILAGKRPNPYDLTNDKCE